MNKEIAREMWLKLLQYAANGEGRMRLVNPICLTQEYDDVSIDESVI